MYDMLTAYDWKEYIELRSITTLERVLRPRVGLLPEVEEILALKKQYCMGHSPCCYLV